MPANWEKKLFAYDSSNNLIYRGLAATLDITEAEPKWFVFKYTWDANGNLLDQQGPKVGSWQNRENLFN